MRAFLHSIWAIGLLSLTGCTQTVTPPPLQSLTGSGQVSILCREMTTGQGRDRRACPDSDYAISDGEDRHTLALVTQTIRGEVAVVDLHSQAVLDANPLLPGKEFLPVGKNPTAIVSTPGGVATFVVTAEKGFEAIYALPTTCITAPEPNAASDEQKKARELTLWSACRLPPGRPGRIAIVTDTTAASSSDPTSATTGYRASCPSAPTNEEWNPVAADRTDCPANLVDEEQIAPAGRRKLLVTLPEKGLVAIYDAQAILNLEAGSFGECVPDSVIALSTLVPAAPTDQVMPADWVGAERPTYSPFEAPREGVASRPMGIAVAGDRLYVADVGVPLIHVVDLKDTCNPLEGAPLRPLDFDDPSRVVLTSEVAVSDMTLAGQAKHQRFLYAVDYDGPRTVDFDNIGTSRSIMAFDLSDGASKAPIVRSHVPDSPFEPPDRIRFESPIKKLQIVTHDAPAVDPATKTAQIGTLCDPYPDATAPGSLYRNSADYTTGAGPRKLRGIFGAVTLSNGQVVAIDIEDWDAPCRRPKSNNPGDGTVDWLGCAHDQTLAAKGFSWFAAGTDGDDPTVTDESSCNVIEPHRLRSGRFFRTDTTLGSLAPSLSGYPRLSSIESGDLPTGKSDVDRKHPQMLAVPFSDSGDCSIAQANAFLNVGTARYEQCGTKQDIIETEPASAEHNSLFLPLKEPRVYYSQESFSATYEGTVIAERGNGWLPRYSPEEATARYGRAIKDDEILLRDPEALFCANGVEDYGIARKTGQDSFKLSDPGQLDRFAQDHADFVVFTGDFDSTDPYWAKAANQKKYCPDTTDPYRDCVSWFGTRKDKKTTREFTIRESQNDDLVIAPRDVDSPDLWVEHAQCCFRNVAAYEVRAGKQWVVKGASLLSQMNGGGENQACTKDTSQRRSKLRSRVFEIASASDLCKQDETTGKPSSKDCAIGAADPAVDVCVTAEASRGIWSELDSGVLPAECLFNALKGRFAIYRGQQPSVRDMAFKWTISGGFAPLGASIASSTVGLNVLPMDMVYSESMDAFVIVDGASGGLNLVGMANFSALGQPYL